MQGSQMIGHFVGDSERGVRLAVAELGGPVGDIDYKRGGQKEG